MTEKEFKKLKPGDKVKIVSKKTKSEDGTKYGCWNTVGLMDRWLGRTMTVSSAPIESANMETFHVFMSEDGGNWRWYPWMIEHKVDPVNQIKYIVSDRKTVIKLPDGRTGVAWRNPEDKDDPYIGAAVALARAFGREFEVPEIPTFKFGDRVRLKPYEPGQELFSFNREEWEKTSVDKGVVIFVCGEADVYVAFSNGKIWYTQSEYLIKEDEA